jgi:hypothetical protein
MAMLKAQLDEYVVGLDARLRGVYEVCDSMALTAPDTLEDDYQIAAEILNVFEKYAQRLADVRNS